MADTHQNQGNTAFLQALWSDAILNYATINYNLRNSILDFSSLTGGQVGENIQVPTLSQETAVDYNAISDDSAVTFSSNTDGMVAIVCDQQPTVGKRIKDIVQVQASFDVFDGFARSMGQAISRAVENNIRTKMVADTTTTPIQLGADTTVTDAEYLTGFESAYESMLAGDITPDDGEMYCYCSPAMYKALLVQDGFSFALNRGDASNPVVTGALGLLYGCKIVPSSLWDNGTLADGECEGTMFHRNSTGVAFSIEPHAKAQENVAYLATDLVASCCMGSAVLGGSMLVNILV